MKLATLISVLVLGFSAFAHDHHKMPNLTAEQRSNMAEVHEKMAACLRKDTPLEDCHKEMMKLCEDKMGKEGCPMMGHMEHMGKMHGKMEKMHEGTTEPKKE